MATPKARTSETTSVRGARHGPLSLPDVPLKPRPVPATLMREARPLWRELWASPIAALWREEDVPVVERLLTLRVRLAVEGLEAPGWLFGAMQGLEDRLLLNPRSRRSAGVAIVPPPEQRNGRRRKLDTSRKARLLSPVS
jgi:hypothetical protein